MQKYLNACHIIQQFLKHLFYELNKDLLAFFWHKISVRNCMFFSFLDYGKEFSALYTILFKKPHYEYFAFLFLISIQFCISMFIYNYR